MKKGPVNLLVDDDKDRIRALATATSRQVGLDLVTTIDKATRYLTQRKGLVARVVADWKLDPGDGLDFLLWVRRTYPSVKCILLTGFTDELFDEYGLEAESVLQQMGIHIRNKTHCVTPVAMAQLLTADLPDATIDLRGLGPSSLSVRGILRRQATVDAGGGVTLTQEHQRALRRHIGYSAMAGLLVGCAFVAFAMAVLLGNTVTWPYAVIALFVGMTAGSVGTALLFFGGRA